MRGTSGKPTGKHSCSLDDEAVYVRTAAGQREVIFGDRRLSDIEQRVLLVVNGNTSLRALLDLIDDRGDAAASIRRLVELDLLRLVKPT